jgi:hypothetical protein
LPHLLGQIVEALLAQTCQVPQEFDLKRLATRHRHSDQRGGAQHAIRDRTADRGIEQFPGIALMRDGRPDETLRSEAGTQGKFLIGDARGIKPADKAGHHAPLRDPKQGSGRKGEGPVGDRRQRRAAQDRRLHDVPVRLVDHSQRAVAGLIETPGNKLEIAPQPRARS